MSALKDGLEIARGRLLAALAGPIVNREPWDEIVAVIDAGLLEEAAGNKNAAIQQLDIAYSLLRAQGRMRRGPQAWELSDMEDARVGAMRALDAVPRQIN